MRSSMTRLRAWGSAGSGSTCGRGRWRDGWLGGLGVRGLWLWLWLWLWLGRRHLRVDQAHVRPVAQLERLLVDPLIDQRRPRREATHAVEALAQLRVGQADRQRAPAELALGPLRRAVDLDEHGPILGRALATADLLGEDLGL
ncbi:MAG: hypothetical protein KDK70_40955, partial [Myxococcales bacterium]|nr:hypothetical protein [Myxococcales bacterium]